MPHVDVRRVEPLYTDTALVLGLAGSLMDINEEQPLKTFAPRHAKLKMKLAGTARLTSMRSSRVEGVRADARQAGAGSSIFDDNEEQTHLRVHKQRPLTAEAACSSIKQHSVHHPF